MPNANVIERLVGANSPAQGALVIPAYSPSTTNAAVVLNQLGAAAVVNVGGSQMLSASTTATTTGTTAVNFDGFAFKLRLVGKITTGASTNVTIAIQLGASTTTSSSLNVAATGAVAVNTASANFIVEAVCVWDGVSGKLGGYQVGNSNQTVLTYAALANAVAATSQASLQFVPVITASATNASTIVTITEFVAETV